MALITLERAQAGPITVRLVEHDIDSFALIFEDGNLSAIAYRATDLAYAQKLFKRSIDIAEAGLTHPAWAK